MASSIHQDPIAKLAAVWAEALADLGVAASVVCLGDAVLVPSFGGTGGMLCLLDPVGDRIEAVERRAQEIDAGWSFLNDAYLTYDRDLFIDTLNDWGWSGSGAPPVWYSGEPWS